MYSIHRHISNIKQDMLKKGWASLPIFVHNHNLKTALSQDSGSHLDA